MDNNISQNIFLDDNKMKNMLLKISEDARRKIGGGNSGVLEFECDSFEGGQMNDSRKIFTPSRFSVGDGLRGHNDNEQPPTGDYTLGLIRKKVDRERMKSKLDGLAILNWLEAYNRLNENKKIDIHSESKMLSVYDTVANFFGQLCFLSKEECIACEVTEIKIIDSLQVIECKVSLSIVIFQDFHMKTKDITFQELNVSDSYFRKGNILLIKRTCIEEYMDISIVSIKKAIVI
jgi:hypothetical protein